MMDPMIHSLLNGDFGRMSYSVAGEDFSILYFLVDGIYPHWASFIGPISSPTSTAEAKFSKAQEAARKDVERLFGVVKGRFKIIRSGNRVEYWSKSFVVDVITVRF
jgi:hypothetical protein